MPKKFKKKGGRVLNIDAFKILVFFGVIINLLNHASCLDELVYWLT